MKKAKGHIGERIAALRRARNISLPDLAKQSGVSKGYLSQLENGIITNPSIDTISKVAQALDITVAELLETPSKKTTKAPLKLDKALEQFIRESKRKGRAIPDDVVDALSRLKKRRKPLQKEDWAYLYETIRRVLGIK